MTFNELENPEMAPQGIPGPVKAVGVFLIACLIVFGIYIANSFEPENPALEEAAALEKEKEPSAADDHTSLRFADEAPPRTDSEMIPLSSMPDDDWASREVIGVAVGDTAHAYVIREIPDVRRVLIVSALVGSKPIVVVHNYFKGRTRVLSEPEGTEVLNVGMGGVDFMHNVVLLYNGARYVMSSERIPLEDYPFEITTLDKWADEYPDTLVDLTEEISDTDYYQAWSDERSKVFAPK